VHAQALSNSDLSLLESHITGADTLSEGQLYEIRDTLIENADQVSATGTAFEAAFATIQLYETNRGALFTTEGTSRYNLAITEGDGLALERTMHELYLAVFDAFNADLINDHLDIVDGLAFGSASYFPGEVAPPTDSESIYEMQINASVPEDWGRPNLYSELPARRPTGTYLSAGTIAEVIVPSELVDKGYQVRVGAHSWDLTAKNSQRRVGRASVLYPITSTVTRVANPLGGNIYIEVPHLADEGVVTIGFKNTVRAPFFSARSFDEMTNEEWQTTERHHPGAFTDIESDKVMLSVPSRWIRDFDDPVSLMEGYDADMDVVSRFMGKPLVRNKTIAFMQVDVLFRGNAFFPGYPMSNYASFDSATPSPPLTRADVINSTFMHEQGHATYMTKFANEVEAAVHNLYVAVATENYGYSIQEAFGTSLSHSKSVDVSLTDALNSWVLRDSFLNNVSMDRSEAGYRFAGHADYVEIMDLFGVEVMESFNRQLNVDFIETGTDVSRNNHQVDDRILRLSRAAGADLTPLLHMWGATPEDAEFLRNQMEIENLPASQKIYDRMMSYTETVPVTQAQYNTFYNEMVGSLWNREFWDPMADNFDPARGNNAIARIEELVDIYFPDGRPDGSAPTDPEPVPAPPTPAPPPSPTPSDAPIVAFSDANFSGQAWPMTAGEYDISAVSNSPIGNDAISSIQIAPGYSVNACIHSGFRICQTFTASVSELGNANNQFSALEVVSDTGFGDWALCANENQQCDFSGTKTVAYGDGDSWSYREESNGVECNNSTFGDPKPGTVKSCYITD